MLRKNELYKNKLKVAQKVYSQSDTWKNFENITLYELMILSIQRDMKDVS